MSQEVLKAGVIVDKYIIQSKIGHGSFGDIYTVYENNDKEKIFALKTELRDDDNEHIPREGVLHQEINGSPYFPTFYKTFCSKTFNYILMEHLGPSLKQMKKLMKNHEFSLCTTIKIGIEMLRAIEQIHIHGIVHRDIKPHNFLIRPSRAYPVVLIDFGLSRRYIDEHTHKMITPRHNPGFVGSSLYASMNAHLRRELGRRDDIIGWFFSLLKIHTGTLPWPANIDKPAMHQAKLQASVEEFCHDLPQQYISIYKYLLSLHKLDEPNYNLIYSFLLDILKDNEKTIDDPLDWENIDLTKIEKASHIKFNFGNEKPVHLTNLPPPVLPQLTLADSESAEEDEESEEDYNEEESEEEESSSSSTSSSSITLYV